MKTEINIKLTSGSVIEAHLSSSIEELDIIACLCESLEKCGAKVANIISSAMMMFLTDSEGILGG